MLYQHLESPLVDVDECASGLHSCHKFASCTNIIGSYTCSCQQYFNGDGKNCQHSVSGEYFSLIWVSQYNLKTKHSSGYAIVLFATWDISIQGPINGMRHKRMGKFAFILVNACIAPVYLTDFQHQCRTSRITTFLSSFFICFVS